MMQPSKPCVDIDSLREEAKALEETQFGWVKSIAHLASIQDPSRKRGQVGLHNIPSDRRGKTDIRDCAWTFGASDSSRSCFIKCFASLCPAEGFTDKIWGKTYVPRELAMAKAADTLVKSGICPFLPTVHKIITTTATFEAPLVVVKPGDAMTVSMAAAVPGCPSATVPVKATVMHMGLLQSSYQLLGSLHKDGLGKHLCDTGAVDENTHYTHGILNNETCINLTTQILYAYACLYVVYGIVHSDMTAKNFMWRRDDTMTSALLTFDGLTFYRVSPIRIEGACFWPTIIDFSMSRSMEIAPDAVLTTEHILTDLEGLPDTAGFRDFHSSFRWNFGRDTCVFAGAGIADRDCRAEAMSLVWKSFVENMGDACKHSPDLKSGPLERTFTLEEAKAVVGSDTTTKLLTFFCPETFDPRGPDSVRSPLEGPSSLLQAIESVHIPNPYFI